MKLLPLLLLLASCASNLTADQMQWRQGIDNENWDNCERVYLSSAVYTLHIGHTHSKRDVRLGKVSDRDIRDDLMTNNCRFILRDYWIEYGYYGSPIVKDSNGEDSD